MATQPDPRVQLAFGPFELDASAGELRKRGIRVRVAGQPFQILLALVERPGELVTREQLREQVWSEGTFVDFEGGLNAAVAKLRRALGDSAENPNYIETVPGRGYRFIGSIQGVSHRQAPANVQPAANVVFIGTETVALGETSHTKDQQPNRKRWITIAACLATTAVAVGSFFYFRRTPALTEKDTIVLADFQNKTGDAVFDGTLRQGLAVQLGQSPFLSLISEERIHQTLRLMGQPAYVRLTPELAREVCERTGSAVVLEGSIAPLGTQYVLGLRANNCSTGEMLDEEQVQAARKEDVLNALAQIARKFRSRAGESLATLRKHETPLAEATTPSLEALKAYSSARTAAFSTGFTTAVPLLQRAIELDPQFGMAHAFLGRIYGDIGESVLSAESTRKAYQVRDRATDRERFYITFTYDRQVTGNLQRAQLTAELWAQTYTRESAPHSLLAGFTTQGTGQYEKSIQEAKKAIDLDPDLTPAYLNLAFSSVYLDRLPEAENTLQRASERKLEIADSLVLRYYIAFLRSDKPAMDREVARAKEKPGAEDWMSHSEALVAAYSGHLVQARMNSQRAVDLARRAEQRERAAIYQAGAAVWEGFFENVPAAKRNAMAALDLSNARDVEYGAAFALTLAGDTSRSQALANDLERRFPEDTLVTFTYLPTLRARFALAHDQPSKVVQMLQSTLPYELALPGTAFMGFFGSLYPIYVRGEAYLAAHQGAEAASEFQKILDHRGIVISDPIGALAHLQLGRTFVLSGDKARAKAAYQDFLTLWKDADPGIPILKEAKAEYAKLQ